MPRLPCKLIAVAGGACSRVRKPARSDYHLIGVYFIAALRLNSADLAAVKHQLHGSAFNYGRVTACERRKGINYVGCLVRDGEDSAPSLDLQFNAAALKEFHDVLGHEARECAVKESAVAGNIGYKLLHAAAVIGDIAPALAGYHNFPARPVIALKQDGIRPACARKTGCKHTCGPRTDHEHGCFHSCSSLSVR